MPLNKFIPLSPDPNITRDSDMGMAQFGHLNTIVDYLNTYVAADSLQLDGTGPLSATARYITDSAGNLSSLAISTGNIGIGITTPGAALEIYGGVDTLGISGPANQAKSIQIARYNNSSFQSHYIGDDGGAFFGSGLTISASGTASQLYLQVSAAGRNVNIGSAGQTLLPKDLGARLGVRGSGTTSATTAFLVQNSGGTQLLKVQDDGLLTLSNSIEFSNYNQKIATASIPLIALYSAFLGNVSVIGDGGGGGIKFVDSGGSAYAKMGFGNLNTTIGQSTYGVVPDLGARLGVRGSGSTSATTSLLVQNSGGSQLFKIADDGFTTINGRLYLLGDNIYNSSSQPALGVGNTMYMASNTGIDFSWQNLVQGRFSFTTNVNTNNSVGSPKNSLYTSHTINDGAASSLSEFRSMAVLDTMNMTTFPLTTFIGLFISPTIVSSTTKVRAIQSTIGGAYFNTSSVNATAILQADSTTQGFLKPRLTTAQKNAIVSPAAGLEVYDTDLNRPCFYSGSAWVTL